MGAAIVTTILATVLLNVWAAYVLARWAGMGGWGWPEAVPWLLLGAGLVAVTAAVATWRTYLGAARGAGNGLSG